jgi:hypothetical protein
MADVPSSTAGGSPVKIATATAVAVLVAAALLVTAVLPAEYGIDPLGTGRALGLVALAESAPTAIESEAAGYNVDATDFVLGPYESVEYKYRIEEGGTLLFSWQADRPVIYDFHAEPDGSPEGYAESFDKGERHEAHGSYYAPFSGVHGWYWENGGGGDVTIRLSTAGFYNSAQEYYDGGVFKRAFPRDETR